MSKATKLDETIAAAIAAECMSGDLEVDHCHADEILIDLLSQLGYERTVQAWLAVGKWYA